MTGFGKQLEERKITGKIYHSCTVDGLAYLIQNLNETKDICFSTDEGSIRHDFMRREIILVLEVEEKEGLYTEFDADAGKDFGYDEFRAFFTQKEFFGCLSEICMTKETYQFLQRAENQEIIDTDADWQYTNIYENFNQRIEIKPEMFN